MRVSEFLHLASPEEQWLPTIPSVLRQFAEEECYVYERQSCWYLDKGCQTQLHINADGAQATFIGDAREQKWAVDSIADYTRRFMTYPQVKGHRVYKQVGFDLATHTQGIAFSAGEWPLLALTIPRGELISEKGNVTVYAGSADGCRCLCEWVKEAGTTTQNVPLTVDTALNGEAHKQQVTRAIAEIRRGKYVKVTVSHAIPLSSWIDMPATLLYGWQANTPVRLFMFRQEGREAPSFNPELVISVTGNKVVTEPLVDTRDRTGDPEHSKAKEAELLHDSKKALEHTLSVKEVIAELEAVYQPGSVVVEGLMLVHQRGGIQHLGFDVSGRLAEDRDAWDAFTVLFPSITASGTPKNAVLSTIMQTEKTPRELCSDAILLLDDTRFDAALVLRSVFQDGQHCWVRAGAGIIARSAPERELTETREKLASIAPYLMV